MLRLVAAVALAWTPARSDRGIPLRWEAAAGCPDVRAVQERAAELLSAAQVDASGHEVRASARVYAIPSGWALDLHLEGGRQAGDRHIEAASCEELADAAALILAIAIDPTGSPVVPEPRATADPPATPASPPVAPADAPRPPADAVRDDGGARRGVRSQSADREAARRRRPSGLLRAGVGIDAWLFRPVGASVALGTGLVGRGYRVDLVARYAAPSLVVAPSNPVVRAEAQLWSIGVGACGSPGFPRARLELPLCAAIEAGAMHARGTGTGLAGRRSHSPWLAVALGPGLTWSFSSRLAVWVAVDAVVVIGRPRFVTDGGTEVLRPRRAGMRALVGAEVRFGGERR